MSGSYVIENRVGFPGAFHRVTDETPAEAAARRADFERHCSAMASSFDLQDAYEEANPRFTWPNPEPPVGSAS